MPPVKVATVTYIDGPGNPVLWYFRLLNTAGALVGTEQTFPSPPATVTFSTNAGTYTIKAGQRDAAGADVGVPVTSAPFVVVGTGKLVSTIVVA